MGASSFAVLMLSAFAAGAINSIAGGGTLITYPTLLAVGVAPISANATSNISLVQGSLAAFWAYRKTLHRDRRLLTVLVIPCLLGSSAGAFTLLRISDRSFALVVPWLILGATALFLVANRLRSRFIDQPELPVQGRRLAVLLVVQTLVAVYGGFFGAGQGILVLATLGLSGIRDLDRMNGIKNFVVAVVNSVATVLFAVGRRILWKPALLMAVAAMAGGYAGAWAAQRIPQRVARGIVVGIGLATAAYSFYKAFA